MADRIRLAIAVFCVLVAASCGSNGPREVLLVARGMTYTLPSAPDTPNPVIRVRPGQQVQLTLRNDAPGLMHDFQIPAWNVKTNPIRAGQSATVTFTVPSEVGRYEYRSGPHGDTMHGFIEVTAQ